MDLPDSPNVHKPQQPRSIETLNKVLKACDALLNDRTFEQISMQDIAREAGVSVGNLYNRFRDRESLIEFIIERHQQEFLKSMKETLDKRHGSLSLSERVSILGDTFRGGLNNLKPVFATIVMRRLNDSPQSAGSRETTDTITELAATWLCKSGNEIIGNKNKKSRFAVASMAFRLQFDLLVGTGTRMFGDDYLTEAKIQAYQYLTNGRKPGSSKTR